MDHNRDIPYHWMEGDQPRLSDTGREYVARKAMWLFEVVPFNTPGTKTQPT